MSLLGIIAVMIILYGGFKWMTSGGSDDAVGDSKKIITAGIIGLIIIFDRLRDRIVRDQQPHHSNDLVRTLDAPMRIGASSQVTSLASDATRPVPAKAGARDMLRHRVEASPDPLNSHYVCA